MTPQQSKLRAACPYAVFHGKKGYPCHKVIKTKCFGCKYMYNFQSHD